MIDFEKKDAPIYWRNKWVLFVMVYVLCAFVCLTGFRHWNSCEIIQKSKHLNSDMPLTGQVFLTIIPIGNGIAGVISWGIIGLVHLNTDPVKILFNKK